MMHSPTHGLRTMYTEGMPGLRKEIWVLETLMHEHTPAVAGHMDRQTLEPSSYASVLLHLFFARATQKPLRAFPRISLR